MNNPRTLNVLYYVAYPQRMAGANRSLLELITNLPDKISPFAVFPADGEAVNAFRQAGIPTKIIEPSPSLNQYGKVALQWSYMRRILVGIKDYLPYSYELQNFVRRRSIDLIHANGPRATILVGLACRMSNRPLISHLRGQNAIGGVYWWLFERLANYIISVSSAGQESLSLAAQAKSTIIYNGIQDISDCRNSIPWLEALRREGFLIVCCFASIVPFKGHHHLLSAIAELNKRNLTERVIFVVVGDFASDYRDYQEWLLERQRDLEIVNVFFTGWQSNPFSFYRAADISVLPSVDKEQLWIRGTPLTIEGNEGLPRTHLEAMIFGLPVIGTDIAGVNDQIQHGVNGLLVPPSDAQALADALELLITSPDMRERMGRTGYETVKTRFSTRVCVDRTLEVYREVVPEKGALSCG